MLAVLSVVPKYKNLRVLYWEKKQKKEYLLLPQLLSFYTPCAPYRKGKAKFITR